MAKDQSDDFRVRPGRSRSRGTRIHPRAQPFLKQVQIAVRRAGGNPNQIGRGSDLGGGRIGQRSGRFNARGRGAKVAASVAAEGRGGGWRRDAGGRFRARRVVVKARVVRLNPQRGSRGPKMQMTASKAVDAHLRYLERDGVTRDGDRGRVYSAFEDEADGKAFVARGRGDRHQFRFIVAAEDANEMADLRGFTAISCGSWNGTSRPVWTGSRSIITTPVILILTSSSAVSLMTAVSSILQDLCRPRHPPSGE